MGSVYLDTEKFNIREDYAEFEVDRNTGKKFIRFVYGTLTVDQDYDYLEIEIPVYDERGNLVEKFSQYITRIRAGESWKFRAVGFRADGISYDISKADISTD